MSKIRRNFDDFPGVDRLFAKHVSIATGLLKILRNRIKQIMDDDDHNVIEAKIKHCVLYYNEVIK